MDGCFGLVRKKSAGANLLLPVPRHSVTFFASQTDVDNFVEEYSKKAKEDLQLVVMKMLISSHNE